MTDDDKADASTLDARLAALAGHATDVGPLAAGALPSVFEDEDWPYDLPPEAIEVELHGQPDDHLRLIALVAEGAAGRVDPDLVACCQDPHRPWPERRRAFGLVLDDCIRHQLALYLVDVDALEPESAEAEDERRASAWDDHGFAQQRREALDHLLTRAPRAPHWMFLRPAPKPRVSERLAGLAWDIELPEALEEELASRADTARWRRHLVSMAPTFRRLALASPPPADGRGISPLALLDAAWTRLHAPTVAEAHKLAALRGRQVVNGHYGPLHMGSGARPTPTVDPSDVDRLYRTGWLSPATPPGGGPARRMHRPVREYVTSRAEGRDAADAVRHDLAHRDIDRLPLAERLEVHHHAIEAGDARRAIETVTCYAGHLRQLAIRLSQAGRFAEAARLYREVLSRDAHDAYAWEYLGYNLARDPEGDPREALRALDEASRLDGDNPLYAGRHLGFLAERGESVEALFAGRMRRYAGEALDWTAIRYFAEPVLNGIERGARAGPRPAESAAIGRALSRRWGGLLSRIERLRPFIVSDWWCG